MKCSRVFSAVADWLRYVVLTWLKDLCFFLFSFFFKFTVAQLFTYQMTYDHQLLSLVVNQLWGTRLFSAKVKRYSSKEFSSHFALLIVIYTQDLIIIILYFFSPCIWTGMHNFILNAVISAADWFNYSIITCNSLAIYWLCPQIKLPSYHGWNTGIFNAISVIEIFKEYWQTKMTHSVNVCKCCCSEWKWKEEGIFTYCFLSTVMMNQSIKMPIVAIYLT